MLKRRADMSSSPEGEDFQEGKTKGKYSIGAYVTALFAVMLLLILLSYFIQLRNSNALDDLSEIKQVSVTAIQRAEDLQTKNEELQAESKELQEQIASMETELSTLKDELAASSEQHETLEKQISALQLLSSLQAQISSGDIEAAKKTAAGFDSLLGNLREAEIQLYNELMESLE